MNNDDPECTPRQRRIERLKAEWRAAVEAGDSFELSQIAEELEQEQLEQEEENE